MSMHIGSTITGFGTQDRFRGAAAVQVNTFTGPKGALAVSITPMGGPVDYLEFREAEARKLIQLLEAALRQEHVGDL